MKLLLALGVVAVTLQPAPAVAPAQIVLTSEQVTQDLDLFQAALHQLHPEFVTETRRAELKRFLDEVRQATRDATSDLALYRLLSPVAGVIRDGHTVLRLPEVLPSRESWRLLPLQVFVPQADGTLWVRWSGTSRVPVGSRILSVNGQDATSLLEALSAVEPRDGAADAATLHGLGRGLRFSQLLAARFGDRAEYRVEVIRPGARSAEVLTLEGQTLQALGEVPARPSTPVVSFDPDGRTAVLTLPDFGRGSGSRVRDAFQTVRAQRTPGLILDLRDNGGGSDEVGKELLAQFAAAPFRYYRDLTVSAAPDRPEFAVVATRIQDLPLGADGKRHVPSPNLGLHQPVADAFAGPVVVLIDGGTFSSAAEFASVARAIGRVTIVGQESGGGACANNSGVIFPITLPHSRLRLSVPLVHYELEVPCEKPGSGVIPDHRVALTAADLFAGRDPQMALARRLVIEQTAGQPAGTVPSATPVSRPATSTTLGDSIQAQRVKAFVEGFNAGEDAFEAMRLDQFRAQDPAPAASERRRAFYRALQADFGTLQVVRVVASTTAEIQFIARKKTGQESLFHFRFAATAPFKIAGFSVETP